MFFAILNPTETQPDLSMRYKVALSSSQFTGHGLPFVKAAKTLNISFIFLPINKSFSQAYLTL